MDANGTRFHLLLGRDDWADRCAVVKAGAVVPAVRKLRDEFEAAPPLTLRGRAAVRGGYLIAGAVEMHGLLLFDLRTGGAPRQLVWPAAVPFEPFDLAETPDGGVAVLDQRHARVWRLNASFEVVA